MASSLKGLDRLRGDRGETSFLGDAQAETRFRAYRERNAALLERADRWRQEAEARLRAQGDEPLARERAADAGGNATAAALTRVREELDKVRDLRAMCTGKVEAIASGRYDLSLNAELVGLLSLPTIPENRVVKLP